MLLVNTCACSHPIPAYTGTEKVFVVTSLGATVTEIEQGRSEHSVQDIVLIQLDVKNK